MQLALNISLPGFILELWHFAVSFMCSFDYRSSNIFEHGLAERQYALSCPDDTGK